MFERFTDRARKVMALANQEAQRFNHEYIGTEHILLGLVKEGSGVAANTLKDLDIDLRKVRLEVEKIVKTGPDMVTMGKLPQTPRTQNVIKYAIEEARNLNHSYVGTEHILLGLLREDEGVAAQVLRSLGVKLEDVRKQILALLNQAATEDEAIANAATTSTANSTTYAQVSFANSSPAELEHLRFILKQNCYIKPLETFVVEHAVNNAISDAKEQMAFGLYSVGANGVDTLIKKFVGDISFVLKQAAATIKKIG